MQLARPLSFGLFFALSLGVSVLACESSSSPSSSGGFNGEASAPFDPEASAPVDPDSGATDSSQPVMDAGVDVDVADVQEAGKVIPDGLSDPIPYKSRADSPFVGVVFASYSHFEDWEDGLVNTPGVTPSTTATGAGSLCDSVDGDDSVVDGKCEKAGGCNSGFSISGSIDFTFDAVALGALPTHVGVAWTDGATGCDAIFEAYDAADALIGTKTAAAVGDNSNSGTVDEDRYFTVVHAAGVKRIVVRSSAGGVEVDHLLYGR